MVRGHPWIYSESIKEQNRPGLSGELAVVYDRRNRFLAVGFYDPASPIRVRILQVRKPVQTGLELWRERIREARALRERGGVFSKGTTGGRWINGESDGMPGLVADRYDTTLVVKLYTPGWLAFWDELEAALREELQPCFLVLRLSRNLVDAASAEWGFSEGFRGAIGEETVIFEESGLGFEAQVRFGQKTGFFLDQRENRRRVESISGGLDVLNAFSYSGGFSVYAARGGARSVTDLDISSFAIESAKRNIALNAHHPAVNSAKHRWVQADAFDWLQGSPAAQFDLAVLDPPSLAPREANRGAAREGYAALAAGGIRVLRKGGMLLSASCSSHVSKEEFFETVRSVAQESGRPWQERWTSEHAPDHPANFPEARYLKAICLKLDP